MITGSCLCGSVRFEAVGEPVSSVFCYCRDCQRTSGAGHLPILGFPRAAVTLVGVTKAFETVGISGRMTRRNFCVVCGTMIMGEPGAHPNFVGLSAGTLDDPSIFIPEFAVFSRSQQDWDKRRAVVPAYDTVPSS
jgi:hypothetical protein